jgi:hypothetical protein
MNPDKLHPAGRRGNGRSSDPLARKASHPGAAAGHEPHEGRKAKSGHQRASTESPTLPAQDGPIKPPFELVDLERLGQLIRWIRKRRPGHLRITQSELAARMSEILGHTVDQASISRIEGGFRAMSFPTFSALAQALQVPGYCLVMLAIRDWGDVQADTRDYGRRFQNRLAEDNLDVSIERLEHELGDD